MSSAAGPAVGAHPQEPVADQPSTHPGNRPEGQPLRDEAPLLDGQHTPEHQSQGGDRAEEMPLQ